MKVSKNFFKKMKLLLGLMIALCCNTTYCQINNPIICEWEQNLIDEYNGKTKRQLKPRKFFSYNPDGTNRFFVGKAYLECWAALSELDNKFMLNISIIIQDNKVEEQMGSIAPKATLELTSLKGKKIVLSTFAGCKAQIKDKNTIYKCSFFVPKAIFRQLKNFEIDTVKLNWTKAYQVYTVYYLDFLSDQVKCFE